MAERLNKALADFSWARLLLRRFVWIGSQGGRSGSGIGSSLSRQHRRIIYGEPSWPLREKDRHAAVSPKFGRLS
jgi:hypothetical protein